MNNRKIVNRTDFKADNTFMTDISKSELKTQIVMVHFKADNMVGNIPVGYAYSSSMMTSC